jgi:prepilin-type N-terminal cleavage/methylation domain-containing protein
MTGRERRGRGAGFTLVEVTITMAILAVGLLAMLLVQVQALKDGSRGRHSSTGSMLARDQLELAQNMAFSDSALIPPVAPVWATPPWLANTADPSLNPGEIPVRVAQTGGTSTQKIYTVNYRVSPDPGGNPELRLVDLEVWWNDPELATNQPTRTGRPTAALSTIIVDNDR